MYEIHITCLTSQSAKATKIAKEFHWKTSEIARDPVLGNDTYFYLTTHADTLDTAYLRMQQAVDALYCTNVTVLREKIEHIVHDYRYE